jgi:phosphoglycerate dehydrogenase-like enzyme
VVTPHIAWISREMPERAIRTVLKDVVRLIGGKKPFNILNPEVLTS